MDDLVKGHSKGPWQLRIKLPRNSRNSVWQRQEMTDSEEARRRTLMILNDEKEVITSEKDGVYGINRNGNEGVIIKIEKGRKPKKEEGHRG